MTTTLNASVRQSVRSSFRVRGTESAPTCLLQDAKHDACVSLEVPGYGNSNVSKQGDDVRLHRPEQEGKAWDERGEWNGMRETDGERNGRKKRQVMR